MEKINEFKNLMLDHAKSAVYSEVDGLSLQNLFYVKNGYFPNCFMFSHTRGSDNYFDTEKIYNYFMKNYDPEYFQCLKYVFHDFDTGKEEMGICTINLKDNIFMRIERNVSETYILYGNQNEEALKNTLDMLKKFYVAPEVEKNNLFTISSTSQGYSLIKQTISEAKLEGFSVEKQYNDDFAKEDAKISEFIASEKKSGLVILHGEKGTGKTTYIRHLINTNPEKKFVFVPSGLITLLGEPSFASFLISLSEHIIILEDCENAIKDRRSTGTSSAVSLLLNMTDGLLSDDLAIKFICTFNADVKDIDSALTRKGRLKSKYEFKPLNKDKANKLLEEIYGGDGEEAPKTDKDLTLADIFNYDDDSYTNERKSII